MSDSPHDKRMADLKQLCDDLEQVSKDSRKLCDHVSDEFTRAHNEHTINLLPPGAPPRKRK